jgi:hypothetical protein
MLLPRHSSLHKNGPFGLNVLVTDKHKHKRKHHDTTILTVNKVTSTVLDDRGSFPCKGTDTAGCSAFYTAGQAGQAAHLDVAPRSTFTRTPYTLSGSDA